MRAHKLRVLNMIIDAEGTNHIRTKMYAYSSWMLQPPVIIAGFQVTCP